MSEPTFTLQTLAGAYGLNVTDLHAWIKRGLLRFVGPVPQLGKPRRFNLLGVIEVALIRALVDGGLGPMPRAAGIVHQELSRHLVVAAIDSAKAMPLEDAMRRVEINADYPIHSDLANRNTKRPTLWVVMFDKNGGHALSVAHGWIDVHRAVNRLPVTCDRPCVFVFNVTSALLAMDQKLAIKNSKGIQQ